MAILAMAASLAHKLVAVAGQLSFDGANLHRP
jgi:hypothetical protein